MFTAEGNPDLGFLCTVDSSVTPRSRDLLTEGDHGAKASMNSNWGKFAPQGREVHIHMGTLMLLFTILLKLLLITNLKW